MVQRVRAIAIATHRRGALRFLGFEMSRKKEVSNEVSDHFLVLRSLICKGCVSNTVLLI